MSDSKHFLKMSSPASVPSSTTSACGCPNVVVDEFRLPSGNNILDSCAPMSYQSSYGMGIANLAPVDTAQTVAVPTPAPTQNAVKSAAQVSPVAGGPVIDSSVTEVQGVGLPFDYGQVNYPGASFPYFLTGAAAQNNDSVVGRVSGVFKNMSHDFMRTIGIHPGVQKGAAASNQDAAVERLRPFWNQRMRAAGGVHDENAFQRWARTVSGRIAGAQAATSAPAAPAAPVVVNVQQNKPWYKTFTGVFIMVLLSLGIIGGISYLVTRRYIKNKFTNIKDLLKERADMVRERMRQ